MLIVNLILLMNQLFINKTENDINWLIRSCAGINFYTDDNKSWQIKKVKDLDHV